MDHWIDEESESNNVIAVNESTIFIGSCDKEAYCRVDEQLTNKDSPIEVLGTDDLTTIPLKQVQNLISRSTDKDVVIKYKAKKEIEETTLYFDSLEKKHGFMSTIDQFIPEHLVRNEADQSVISAAMNPLISLILSVLTTYLFFDKFRWPAIIIGGIWALGSIYMLSSRIKEPPTIISWAISGRYFRKLWHSIKLCFSYAFLALIVVAVYGKFPDSYGHKSILEQMKHESLKPADISQLLARGADINYKDKNGNSALSLALDWSEDELAISLIESGADLSLNAFDEQSPLEYAIYNDANMTIVSSMLKNGASLAFKIDGMTPIEYSKKYENIALEKIITEYLSL